MALLLKFVTHLEFIDEIKGRVSNLGMRLLLLSTPNREAKWRSPMHRGVPLFAPEKFPYG